MKTEDKALYWQVNMSITYLLLERKKHLTDKQHNFTAENNTEIDPTSYTKWKKPR